MKICSFIFSSSFDSSKCYQLENLTKLFFITSSRLRLDKHGRLGDITTLVHQNESIHSEF